MYIDNLADEVKHEITKETSVNKKYLSLAVIKEILKNKEAKQQIIVLFEKKNTALNNVEIQIFLNQISTLIHNSSEEQEQLIDKEEPVLIADFPVRTYVIATIFFYRLAITNSLNAYSGYNMKSFSYKKILAGKIMRALKDN